MTDIEIIVECLDFCGKLYLKDSHFKTYKIDLETFKHDIFILTQGKLHTIRHIEDFPKRKSAIGTICKSYFIQEFQKRKRKGL